jgi:iron complex outermembrane recepter protein
MKPPRTPPRTLLRTLLAAVAALAASVLSAQTAASVSSPEEVKTLSVFTVTDSKDEGYRSSQTISGSRTVEDLRNTPNSISIFNRELITDLMATTMAELSMYGLTGETNVNNGNTIATYVFRGIPSNFPLRDGLLWITPLDTYNIERVELLRGPNSFLFGEGAAGGSYNQITKKALSYPFARVTAMAGSESFFRGELDLNRPLHRKLDLRVNLAAQSAHGRSHSTHRDFTGITLALQYRPFHHTIIDLNAEWGNTDEVRQQVMFAEAFSTSDLTGASTALTALTGGPTFVPGRNLVYNTVGTRRTTGTNIIIANEDLVGREENYWGPSSYFRNLQRSYHFEVQQRVGENLSLQASVATLHTVRDSMVPTGSGSASIYRDTLGVLPNGAPNPYLNELYTDFYFRRRWLDEIRTNARASAVYELKLPFTTQKLIATANYNADTPLGTFQSEFVSPGSPPFVGALVDANTLAAYQANFATMRQNYFYRRAYLKDGDKPSITSFDNPNGRAFLYDIPADGATGRQNERLFLTPGYGFGSSGTFFRGRINTLVGWRHDSFLQDSSRDYVNPVSGTWFTLPGTPRVKLDYGKDSYNYGLVLHPAKLVSAYFNYAQSVGLSNGVGAPGFIPGTLQGLPGGDGYEYGLRWSVLGGRIESNWTYYISNGLRLSAGGAGAGVSSELAEVFGVDYNPTGADTQTTRASGIEIETTANLTKNWRLTWNLSTNELETADRYPQLREFQARAKGKNQPTPLTNQFLAAQPDGVPLPGFTKSRSNLVTNYTFTEGRLKGVAIGGGFQFRGKQFQGIFDRNRDGVAEHIYAPGYTLWNLQAGYAATILKRRAQFSLNVFNVSEERYYRVASLASGSWGAGRSFRASVRTQF